MGAQLESIANDVKITMEEGMGLILSQDERIDSWSNDMIDVVSLGSVDYWLIERT